MHKTTLASIVLVLASSAHAQSNATTFPVGYDSTDGGYYSYYVGIYQNGRAMIVTGGLQGSNKVMTWKKLSFRRSTTNTTANTGRSWTNVTLSIADCDFRKLSDTYARNQISTPTKVFSAAVTWPDTPAAKPPNTPATWGKFATAGDLTFPFSQQYVHLGKWGTSFDWQFSGGTLKNAVTWGATSARLYYTDGVASANQSANVSAGLTPTVTGCRSGYFVNWLWSDHVVGGGAQLRTQPYTQSSLPNAQHIGVMGIENGSFVGKSLGGSCHQLYMDLSKPFVLFPYKTDANGDYFSDFIRAPFVKSAVNLSVWSQAAYTDTGNFELTRAGKAPIASLPTGTPVAFCQRLYHPDKNRPLGYGPYDSRIAVIYLHQ